MDLEIFDFESTTLLFVDNPVGFCVCIVYSRRVCIRRATMDPENDGKLVKVQQTGIGGSTPRSSAAENVLCGLCKHRAPVLLTGDTIRQTIKISTTLPGGALKEESEGACKKSRRLNTPSRPLPCEHTVNHPATSQAPCAPVHRRTLAQPESAEEKSTERKV